MNERVELHMYESSLAGEAIQDGVSTSSNSSSPSSNDVGCHGFVVEMKDRLGLSLDDENACSCNVYSHA